MDSNADPPAGVSLVRGGPVYRAQKAVRLVRSDQRNFGRRIIFLIAVGLLPLFLITALQNPEALIPNPGLSCVLPHAHCRSRRARRRTSYRNALSSRRRAYPSSKPSGPSDLTEVDSVIATLVRVRDFFCLVLLIVRTATSYRGLVASTHGFRIGPAANSS